MLSASASAPGDAGRRVEWIDALRGIGMFLVLLGHSSLTGSVISKYIYSFHMPLFFFISGIVFNERETSGGIRKFILKKIKTRMVPYVIFGLLTYCTWLLQIVLKGHGVYKSSRSIPDDIWTPLLGMAFGRGFHGWEITFFPMLWFLTCLFVVEIIFFVMITKIKTRKALLLVLLSFAVVSGVEASCLSIRFPWTIDIALSAVVFYGLGHMSKDYLTDPRFNIWLALLCLAAGIGFGYFNSRIAMGINRYGNPILFYLAALSSIYAYVYIARHMPDIKLVNYVGRNSIVFFLLENQAFYVVNGIIYVLARIAVNSLQPSFAYACGYVMLSVFLLIPASYIINSRIPSIIGRSQAKLR